MLREALVNLFQSAWKKREAEERKTLWALRDIEFQLKAGEYWDRRTPSALASTCRRSSHGSPSHIRIHPRARQGCSLLEVGTGFHESLPGAKTLSERPHSRMKKQIDAKLMTIAFAEIEQFIDTPIKRY